MKLIKKLVLILLIGAFAAWKFGDFNQEDLDNAGDFISPLVKTGEKVLGETTKRISEKLIKKEKTAAQKDPSQYWQQDGNEPVFLQEEEVVDDTADKLDVIIKDKVNQEVDKLEELPQQKIDQLKKEIMKEVRKQVCEQWLQAEE
jgi:hypothetical protein